MTLRHEYESRLKTEAVEWLITLADPDVDPEDTYPEPSTRWRAFCTWYTQSAEHMEAFIQAAETSHLLSQLDPRHLIDVRTLLRAPQSNIVPLPASSAEVRAFTQDYALHPSSPMALGWRSGKLNYQRSKREWCFPMRWWALCAVLTALVVLPLGILRSPPTSPIFYSSDIGQRLFVPLEDGSSMHLNTTSRVAVQFTARGREVQLLQGEVLFDVRHDAARPFRVIAGGVIIRDLGTKFTVYKRAHGAIVAVVNGQVEVSAAAMPSQSDFSSRGNHASATVQTAVISAGTRAELAVEGAGLGVQQEKVSVRELDRQLAWQNGLVSFEGETLAEAVREINRYNRIQLRVIDPVVANYRVGGTFKVTDACGFASTLSKTFKLQASPVTISNEIEIYETGTSHSLPRIPALTTKRVELVSVECSVWEGPPSAF